MSHDSELSLIAEAMRSARRPRGISRAEWKVVPRAALNFAADAVDNLRDQYPDLQDDLIERLLCLGIRHRLAGGERDAI